MPPATGANPRSCLQRVGPDDAVGDPAQASHLFAEQLGPAPVPAVRDHDDRGASGQASDPPRVVEGPHALAEAGAARPVVNGVTGGAECSIGVP